jgi:hypothetical protein
VFFNLKCRKRKKKRKGKIERERERERGRGRGKGRGKGDLAILMIDTFTLWYNPGCSGKSPLLRARS